MKSKIFCISIFLLFISSKIHAQQWLDKKYDFQVLQDSVYGYATNFFGGIDTLRMDIYSPDCDDVAHTSLRPLIVWIHGGSFLAGDKNDNSITNLCEEFARRGYVTASIDYRLGFASDNNAHACNFPDYECLFAADSAEWVRAYYRSVQDTKGAVRYLVNRYESFRIDTNNIFTAGESAGAFAALGAALMDVESERPVQTFSTTDLPLPGTYAQNCAYNVSADFEGEWVSRPDLGGITGEIEPTSIQYTIKGVGNMFGGMFGNLLAAGATEYKPAIYSFHQRCDLVVPIDSGVVFQGVSWCLANGYNCYPFANNNVKIYGSRTIRDWNEANNYGYNIQSDFASVEFPYSFLFGEGSCVDQGLNLGCHGYANKELRESNLAEFFAPLVSTFPVCDTAEVITAVHQNFNSTFEIFPNPVGSKLNLKSAYRGLVYIRIASAIGNTVLEEKINFGGHTVISLDGLTPGVYFVRTSMDGKPAEVYKILKQ